MKIEAFAVRLRPRSNMEAADLGVRLCQSAARSVYSCYWAVALPLVALCLSCFQLATWIPTLGVWLAKPWADRTILFVLSRAAFGQDTSLSVLWQARREIWGRQLVRTWTLQRLSAWRSLTQPVYQLEGLHAAALRKRVAQIRLGAKGAATLVSSVFGLVELILLFGLISLGYWLAPKGYTPNFTPLLSGNPLPAGNEFALQAAYCAVVLFLEPFYVAAGFAMYLNRRAQLEAWDIEQEFRRAFAA